MKRTIFIISLILITLLCSAHFNTVTQQSQETLIKDKVSNYYRWLSSDESNQEFNHDSCNF